jgi:hypothetical protein
VTRLCGFAAWASGRRAELPARGWLILGTAALIVAADAFTTATMTLSYRPVAWDALVYWEALGRAEPYAQSQLGILGSYLYSPAFLVLLAPLTVLGWHGFLFVLTACLAACGLWLIERVPEPLRAWWPLLAGIAFADAWAGNVHLPLTVAIVLGVRTGPAWAAVALTKITPAIGALWHVVHRDWRALRGFAAALGVAVGLSLLAGFEAWPAWIGMLLAQDRPVGIDILPLPLPVRLVIAAAVLAWGAAHDRAWTVPLACLLALPAVWPTSPAMLLGVAALWRPLPRPWAPSDAALAHRIGGG